MIRSLACAAVAACLACSASPDATGANGREQPERPNVVLILADDLGLEALTSYGASPYATPHLDALARSGMRFEHAYSQPLCTPSRVKLMTGRSNLRNYVHFSILAPGERTFAHVLKEAGYATAAVGKWQLFGAQHYGDWAGRGQLPSDAGFDTWCLWQVAELGPRYWGPRLDRDGVVSAGRAETYGPDETCAHLLRFIEAERDGPFLAYFPMALTHSPFEPTPLSAPREQDKQANFADMVAYMDVLVGRIVRKLDELDLTEKTLVLFTSDNGTDRPIRTRVGERVVRGGKGLSTDAGTHVPLIASWPGTVPAGSTCADLVDFSDFLPTLAELGGAELEVSATTVDGRSFAPQLLGRQGEPREWITCYSNPRPGNPKFPPVLFARDQRFKLYSDGRLFDVCADAGEEHELAPDAPNRQDGAQRARQKLTRALASMPPWIHEQAREPVP